MYHNNLNIGSTWSSVNEGAYDNITVSHDDFKEQLHCTGRGASVNLLLTRNTRHTSDAVERLITVYDK